MIGEHGGEAGTWDFFILINMRESDRVISV